MVITYMLTMLRIYAPYTMMGKKESRILYGF